MIIKKVLYYYNIKVQRLFSWRDKLKASGACICEVSFSYQYFKTKKKILIFLWNDTTEDQIDRYTKMVCMHGYKNCPKGGGYKLILFAKRMQKA